MNPSLLIIGSLALNFHHYNIQSHQKKYKPIRTINDLDLIVSSDFLDLYLANLKTSRPDWMVTLQDKSSLKKSYLFKLPNNNLPIYVEFDVADKSGNSNDLALEYVKQCGYPSLSFEQYQEILDCLIENFAKNLVAERNLEGLNSIYRKLSKNIISHSLIQTWNGLNTHKLLIPKTWINFFHHVCKTNILNLLLLICHCYMLLNQHTNIKNLNILLIKTA